MLLEKVDVLSEEHREWLSWGRAKKNDAGEEKVNVYFRIYLIVLHRFDAEWAWRELDLWLHGKPQDFLIRAMWQFLRVRREDVVRSAIEAESRWVVGDQSERLSLGGLLAHCAVVIKDPVACDWLDALASGEQMPAVSTHGVLRWMRERAWLSKDEAVRTASRNWLRRAAANARVRREAAAAHEICFGVSACLAHRSHDEDPLSEDAKRDLICAWQGVLIDLAATLALNAYEVWQALGVADAWLAVDPREASEALRVLAERQEGGVNGAAAMMHARDVVATIRSVATRIGGDPFATRSLLSLIERLVLTRSPKANALLPLRLELARSIKSGTS